MQRVFVSDGTFLKLSFLLASLLYWILLQNYKFCVQNFECANLEGNEILELFETSCRSSTARLNCRCNAHRSVYHYLHTFTSSNWLVSKFRTIPKNSCTASHKIISCCWCAVLSTCILGQCYVCVESVVLQFCFG